MDENHMDAAPDNKNDQNELIRRYLNRITMQIMWAIPRAERLAIREEVKQHLTALVEDEIARGKPPVEATRIALWRFGDPNKVGKDIRKKWQKSHPGQVGGAWVAGFRRGWTRGSGIWQEIQVSQKQHEKWPWVKFACSFCLALCFFHTARWFFERVFHIDINGLNCGPILLSLLHGSLFGLCMGIWLNISGYSHSSNASYMPLLQERLNQNKQTAEQRAEEWAEELEEPPLSPEQAGLSHAIVQRARRRIRLYLWIVGLACAAFLISVPILTIVLTTRTSQQQSQWCFWLGYMATFFLVNGIKIVIRRLTIQRRTQ